MSEKELEKKEEIVKETAVADGGLPKENSQISSNERFGKKEYKKNPRRSSKRENRPRSEFDNKIVSIRRVTRVAAGGRRFTFSVTLVAGNRKGKVGIGQGKAGDTPLAIEKALRQAKKNMIDVKVTKTMSIPHDSLAKFGGSKVIIIPAPGRGLLAGSSVRTVLEMAGLTSVNAKILSTSKNPVNNAKAALKALSQLSNTQTPRFK